MILPSIQLRPNVDVGNAVSLLRERAANFRNEAAPLSWTNLGLRRNA